MGQVKRVLAVKKPKHLENGYCGIELCETVHIHMPGFRFELDAKQFEKFAKAVNQAFQNWIKLGKPATAEFIPLGGEYLPGITVYPDRFEVEEQTIPVIHIHLRGLSIRLSIQDFTEFADVMWEAKQNLKGKS